MWSPISRVGIIEPDGIWNASTTKARSSSATATATPIDSEYSRSVDLRAKARWSSIASSRVAIVLRCCSRSSPASDASTASAAAATSAETAAGIR